MVQQLLRAGLNNKADSLFQELGPLEMSSLLVMNYNWWCYFNRDLYFSRKKEKKKKNNVRTRPDCWARFYHSPGSRNLNVYVPHAQAQSVWVRPKLRPPWACDRVGCPISSFQLPCPEERHPSPGRVRSHPREPERPGAVTLDSLALRGTSWRGRGPHDPWWAHSADLITPTQGDISSICLQRPLTRSISAGFHSCLHHGLWYSVPTGWQEEERRREEMGREQQGGEEQKGSFKTADASSLHSLPPQQRQLQNTHWKAVTKSSHIGFVSVLKPKKKKIILCVSFPVPLFLTKLVGLASENLQRIKHEKLRSGTGRIQCPEMWLDI